MSEQKEKCPICKQGILANAYTDEYEKFVKEFSCGHKECEVVVADSSKGTENIIVGYELFFELKDKVYIGGDIINSPNIELISDDTGKYLTAFIIKMQSPNEDAVKDADELANRLTNYLGGITRMVVEHKRPRIRIKHNGKTTNTFTFTIDAILVKNQDLDIEKISSFLNSDSRTHQHLFQAQKGLEALQNNDFSQAIRWYFMIIEKQQIANKYRPLRNVVSHEELDKDYTIDGVAQFGITMNKGDHLNFNDPYIQDILEQEAKNLHDIIWPLIDSELN